MRVGGVARAVVVATACAVLGACGAAATATALPTLTPAPTMMPTLALGGLAGPTARVVAVEVSGAPGAYTFQVTVASPDMGCDSYADWWEILSITGDLLYRRVLLHSHVSEQPFTRSGGPVAAETNTALVVRVHMSTGSYGAIQQHGSVAFGFFPTNRVDDFAMEAATLEPLPAGCAF